jgi:hypothetical protein
MMNAAAAPPSPVLPQREPKGLCGGKAFWCFNPMANKRQAALEAQVEDLTSKLEEAMKSQQVLSGKLLDAEQQLTKAAAENDDLRRAGVSFRKTAEWKVRNQFSKIPSLSASMSAV